ncbi:MAG: hypothetical protein HOP95_04790 [Sphingomonas sp.]|nr:hypothetical protein [Sphingomonas sp.]
MIKMAMSQAAASLIRALVARARVERNRILLTDVQSVDWQSLTLTGERHQIAFRVTGLDSAEIARRMCAGLEDAEFSIPGVIVADIAVVGAPARQCDGATELMIEALTVSEN